MVKRPGTGELKAKLYNDILGLKALNKLNNDVHLKADDVEGLITSKNI